MCVRAHTHTHVLTRRVCCREVSLNVAVAVIDEGFQQNLCTKLNSRDLMGKNSLENLVASKMYWPYYVPLVDPTSGAHE